MTLAINNGKLVLKDGKLGTGAACCCGGGCDCSATGSPPAVASQADRGLVWLEFSACIGSGAEGTVDAPPAAGPCDYAELAGAISGISLTSGGAGYAMLGRVAPTVSASVAGGAGATLSVTLAQQSETIGCLEVPFWEVASVSVTAAGSGYSDKTPVSFSASPGDAVEAASTAYAFVAIDPPDNASVTVYSTGGAGAVLSPTWAVSSATAHIPRGGAQNPPFCDEPSRTGYEVTGFTIANGGGGYVVGDELEITFANAASGVVVDWGWFSVSSVSASGAITGIAVSQAGNYGGTFSDRLASVVVESCVSQAGKYYREDANEPPHVAAVTVTVAQEAPSAGVGAVVTATVETDTASADFGKVVSLSLVGAGTGYLSPPLACELPDKLYITWGDTTAEVPLRLDDDFGEFAEFPCSNPAQCRGGLDDTHLEDAGNTWSAAFGTILAPGLECKCDGKLHVTVTLQFVCYECIASTTGFGEYLANTVVTRPNKYRGRTACLRFDTDENGCPVGDAEVVSWQTSEQMVASQCSAPIPFCAGCSPWTNHDGTYFPSDPCPCDATCDLELAPTISLMP